MLFSELAKRVAEKYPEGSFFFGTVPEFIRRSKRPTPWTAN